MTMILQQLAPGNVLKAEEVLSAIEDGYNEVEIEI